MSSDSPAEPQPAPDPSLAPQVEKLYDAALAEVIDAVLAKLIDGGRPSAEREPVVSVRENGLPTIRDAAQFGAGNGCLDYLTLLDPPYNDAEAQKLGRFPPDRFPALLALQNYMSENPQASFAYSGRVGSDLDRFHVRWQMENIANDHFRRFGISGSSPQTRAVTLRPYLRGLFQPKLPIVLAAPIAFLRFDFDRLRIGPDAYIIRMSEALQRARWSVKAYGATGHQEVLAAATHAVVFTGWEIGNRRHLELLQSLGPHPDAARLLAERFFAALRLETGVETGYAQELAITRGWRTFLRSPGPETFAGAAKRYPESFDDFGWIRETVPVISRTQTAAVAKTMGRLEEVTDQRLLLAMRRFNSATIRHDPADAVLDTTIALEILLGDGDNQAISWKLKMRAAALAGIEGTSDAVRTMHADVDRLYALRSSIVHGSVRRKAAKTVADPLEGRQLGFDILRRVLSKLIAAPRFLDPSVIDRDLLLAPASPIPE